MSGQLGQIIYNVKDFMGSGGFISTNGSSMNSTVSSGSGNYDTVKVDIFSDLVSKVGASHFTHLAIQAAAGTRFVIDGTKNMIVGSSGIYEIGDGVTITSLWFIAPYKYTYTTNASDSTIDTLSTIYHEKITQLQNLEIDYANGIVTDSEYEEKKATYTTELETAESNYKNALGGSYSLAYPSSLSNSANYDDLYDVIVNFKY